jgi:hypothetical protein
MISCTVKVDACKAALAEMLVQFGKAEGDALLLGLSTAENTARALIGLQTKRRTGNLLSMTARGATRFDSGTSGGGKTAFFLSSSDHASYIEEGTQPHFIPAVPKEPGSWIRFERDYGSGDYVFAKQVHHPGNKAMPFMAPAAIAAEEAMYNYLLLRSAEITSKK